MQINTQSRKQASNYASRLAGKQVSMQDEKQTSRNADKQFINQPN